MLRSIELESFKAFGKPARIPLAPITLLYGENSAGKSTILQALYLLKQTRECGNPRIPLLLNAENGYVDLGSFEELVFDHDTKRRRVRIRLDVDAGTHDYYDGDWCKWKTVGLRCEFSPSPLDGEIMLAGFSVFGGDDPKPLLSFESEVFDSPQKEVHEILHKDRPPRYRCTHVGDLDRDWWQDDVKRATEYRDRRANTATKPETAADSVTEPEASTVAQSGPDDSALQKALDRLSQMSPEGRDKTIDRLRALVYEDSELDIFLRSEYSLDQYVEFRRSHLPDMAVLHSEYFLPGRVCSDREQLDREVAAVGGPNLWDANYARYYEEAYYCNDPLDHFDRLVEMTLDIAYKIECVLAGPLFALAPVRRMPRRWYAASGRTPEDVGRQGEEMPELLARQPETCETVNRWLERLGVGYRIKPHRIQARYAEMYEIRLEDTGRRRGKDVSLADVGFGTSQVLPIVVQSLVGRYQTITVEQPEVHVHPRLQAELGSLFAETIKEPHENSFIIETHSEHLVLRLQKLVRTGKLSPEDVSIVCISRGKDGSTAQPLRLDQDGDFVDNWPGGFFLERLRELGDD